MSFLPRPLIRLVLAAAVLVLLALFEAFVIHLKTGSPGRGVTSHYTTRDSRHNFNRIVPGMQEKDVEALLGGPRGNYSKRQTNLIMALGGRDLRRGTRTSIWYFDDATVEVAFSKQGRVTFKLMSIPD
jgi:hypothetical protein